MINRISAVALVAIAITATLSFSFSIISPHDSSNTNGNSPWQFLRGAVNLLLPRELSSSQVGRRFSFTWRDNESATAPTKKPTLKAPVAIPDLTKCGPSSQLPDGVDPTSCCPPKSLANEAIIDFVPPDPSSPLRVRPAIQFVDADYIAKLEKAFSLMKALPADDPRNFLQLSNFHCSYCVGSYGQLGFPDLEFSTHGSWVFLPWHRCFMYFFERILGKLIGDDTFALPFWNWDNPDTMTFPLLYTNKSSPLYDPNRYPEHQPPAIVDLDFHEYDDDPTLRGDAQIEANLKLMYRQMITNAPNVDLFIGGAYRAGEDPLGSGPLEYAPHGPMHDWIGEDMINLYTAARDPIFYAHHTNVDRLWTVWKTLGDSPRGDPTDPDFLNASFIFIDENARPVRIKVRDCLDPIKLRYTYMNVTNPWIQARPKLTRSTKPSDFNQVRRVTFPLTLGSTALSTKVNRTPWSSSAAKSGHEVLVVYDIEVEGDEYVKFDVYVNAAEHYREVGAGGRERAGSFVKLPNGIRHGKRRMKSRLRMCIDEILEDMEAQGDESIVVTLVPKKGKRKVKIGGMKIEIV